MTWKSLGAAAMLALLLLSPAAADVGGRVRTRAATEAATVASTRDLPPSLLKIPARKPAPAAPRSQTQVLPGVSVAVDVPVHDFGLGQGHPERVSQRESFRVGTEANQATWALTFLPHQPELRSSLVEVFRRLAADTGELSLGPGWSELAAQAGAGESPAVLLARHRELVDRLADELGALGGQRRWYFDLGYNAQQLRMVLFFRRSGMVGQGVAAMRILAQELRPESLDPKLKQRLDALTSASSEKAVQGEVDRLLGYF